MYIAAIHSWSRISDKELTGNYRYRFSRWLRRPILQLEWRWKEKAPLTLHTRWSSREIRTMIQFIDATMADLDRLTSMVGPGYFDVDRDGDFTGKRCHQWLRRKDKLMLVKEQEYIAFGSGRNSENIGIRWVKAIPADLYPFLIAD